MPYRAVFALCLDSPGLLTNFVSPEETFSPNACKFGLQQKLYQNERTEQEFSIHIYWSISMVKWIFTFNIMEGKTQRFLQ